MGLLGIQCPNSTFHTGCPYTRPSNGPTRSKLSFRAPNPDGFISPPQGVTSTAGERQAQGRGAGGKGEHWRSIIEAHLRNREDQTVRDTSVRSLIIGTVQIRHIVGEIDGARRRPVGLRGIGWVEMGIARIFLPVQACI